MILAFIHSSKNAIFVIYLAYKVIKIAFFNSKSSLLFNIYNTKILCINRQVRIFTFLRRFWAFFTLKSFKKKLHKSVIILTVFIVQYNEMDIIYIIVSHSWTTTKNSKCRYEAVEAP